MGRQVGGIRVSQGSHKQPWQKHSLALSWLVLLLEKQFTFACSAGTPKYNKKTMFGVPAQWLGPASPMVRWILAWLHLAKSKPERQKASLLHLNTFLHALLWQLSELIWSHVPVVYLSFFSFLCSPPSLPLGPADRPRGWGRNVPSTAVRRNFTAQC